MKKNCLRRRNVPRRKEDRYRVRVRRDRPTGLAWAVALTITMLMVYLATLSDTGSIAARSVSAAPRITREVSFGELDMYLVSLYGCASGEEARMPASGYTGRGAAGYVHETDSGWEVLGAAYEKERDANRIAQRLSQDEGLDAKTIHVSAAKVDMRITAPEVQIAAVVDADALLRSQTAQLGNMALQLDRNEIGAGAVCTLCAVAATQANAAAEVLCAIPGASESDLCTALIERLNTLGGMLGTIAGAGSQDTSTLSGMLRCAQIDTFLGQVEMQNRLLSGSA